MHCFLAILAVVHPGPDRSAEPTLKQVASVASQWRNRHLTVFRSSREDAGKPFLSDDGWDLWLGGARQYRFEAYGMWGDGRIVVSDGKALVNDSLDDSAAVELRDSPSSYPALADVFGNEGSHSSPLWYLLSGEGELAHLVSKDAAIAALPAVGKFQVIGFDTAAFGHVSVYYQAGASPELAGVEYDNKPLLKRMNQIDPEDYGAVPDSPMTRHWLGSAPWKLDPSMLSTKVAPGRRIEDLRKKKPLVS